MICPICYNNSTTIFELNAGKFDNSTLYRDIEINACDNCGHIYNLLTNKEFGELSLYYNKEYAPSNLGMSKVGDRPGSNNDFSLTRYGKLYDIINDQINKYTNILDVGCALGGFLGYLQRKGHVNLHGIDKIRQYVERSKFKCHVGDAYNIPYSDDHFDFVVIDQVLEHLQEPREAIKEIKRVLNDEGEVCISVPDASRYNEFYFFDYYWFLMREHVQHFDIEHLNLMMQLEGFELVKYKQDSIEVMSESMILPIITAVYRKNTFKLSNKINDYLHRQFRLERQKMSLINKLKDLNTPLYIWGLGREFLYLWELGLKRCNIQALIDDTPIKQREFLIDGKRIMKSSLLKEASKKSHLLITAFAHKDLLKKRAKELGYKGKIIDI